MSKLPIPCHAKVLHLQFMTCTFIQKKSKSVGTILNLNQYQIYRQKETTMVEPNTKKPLLQFAPMQSSIDEGFWHRLSSLKLNKLGIDDSPIPVLGFFAPCSHPRVSNYLTLLSKSLPSESSEASLIPEPSHGNRNRCSVSGILYNTNTVESFHALDKQNLLKEEAESLSTACNEWRGSKSTTDVPFFLVAIDPNSHAIVRLLKDWEACQSNAHKILFGFYDQCHLPNNPGWPLRNFLALISARWNLKSVQFFCYRENRGFADMSLSLVGEALLTVPQGWKDSVPNAVGWELNKGRKVPRCISLAQSMDPTRLAVSAADLNLKLMRWRALPSLDLSALSSLKCLLLGAGTLGCQVARMLMAWGVRKITLVDNGRVAMSNPLRQSLYTLDNCLNGGEFKATAAVESLKRIFPAVEAEGIVMAIPMPGHPVNSHEQESVLHDCRHLCNLIDAHDAVFLLTDTRESRWLPTLLCANANKITMTAALGFESFLVMRHGAGPFSSAGDLSAETASSSSADLRLNDTNGKHRLGCYFCNDVVAPTDSTSNRTLDQQCTVTRPGLAPIASALAFELLVGILHHPQGIFVEADINNSVSGGTENPLGILPHQIRGSLSQFSQMSLIGHSSSSCTACCQTVISEYRNRGMEFILEAINHPTYLEDVTGLTDLMKSATKFSLETDNEDEFCWLSSSHGTEGPVGDALKCEFKFSPADASPLKSISESDYNMDLKDNIEGLPILDCDKKTSPFDIKLRCEMEVDLDAVPTSLSTFGESDMTSGITDDLMPE